MADENHVSTDTSDEGSRSFWKEFFKQQFHYSKFLTFHRDWRLFIHSPWLPQKWTYQTIYVIYRLIIAVYFFGWFIATLVVGTEVHGSKLFIFLTHWGGIILNLYLLSAAAVTLFYFIYKHHYKKTPHRDLKLSDLQDRPFLEKPCCFKQQESLSVPWYMQFVWILYVISSEMSIEVVVGYWLTFSGTVHSWPVNLHEHLFNIIPGLIDLFVTGLPIRFYQFLYIMGINIIYVIFTAIYYAAGGTHSNGNTHIYSVFDYEGRAVFSSFSVLIFVFVVPVALHSVYWGLYCLRTFILSRFLKKASPETRPSQSTFSVMATSPV
ncbi:PREDICTED: protein rolling stone-like [Amphimedon queenslandica]|uniref:Protein rolling stone n=1 Tax=Amphimedon queenslandica TaxID=400682 RepID=A0A1X7VLB9_AMPQE|nr:PREDICTED: protein rolling stone-like [Amphimedon queenslandica]|eukprot:XP_011409938.1 PREDICTED: protein rolling stone-like [Amphimedon queenslandica]